MDRRRPTARFATVGNGCAILGVVESFDEADSGYPEEGPPGSSPDDGEKPDGSEVRERARPDPEDDQDAPDADDGTATGNRNA